MEHPIDRAAVVLGSQVAIADLLGVSKAAVNQWKADGREVPIQHCPTIEEATSGKVMRWHLRPDDWHLIWPELKGRKGAPPITTEAA
jgi:DNA-binding transcriptional regulator YdaS (Cro superfamily)